MKTAEIRELSVTQLKEKVLEFSKEHMNLRFQKATGQLEKTDRFAKVRKTIARLKTELAARKSAESEVK